MRGKGAVDQRRRGLGDVDAGLDHAGTLQSQSRRPDGVGLGRTDRGRVEFGPLELARDHGLREFGCDDQCGAQRLRMGRGVAAGLLVGRRTRFRAAGCWDANASLASMTPQVFASGLR